MPSLFGVDIAGEIARGFASAGNLVPGVLTQKVQGARTPGSLSAGRSTSTSSHAFQGFLEEGQKRIEGTRQTMTGDFISILGASVSPATAPRVNDLVTIEGSTFGLVELIERDPAAALYVFKVQKRTG